MLVSKKGFTMFTNYDLRTNLERLLLKLQEEIESDDTILGLKDREAYVLRIEKKYRVDPLVIYPDNITVSQQDVKIPGRWFPAGYFVEKDNTYLKPVITFHLPFSGDPDLLKCKPSTFVLWTEEVEVVGERIDFQLINFNNDVDALQKERDMFISRLNTQLININAEVNGYNVKLRSQINASIDKGIAKLKAQNDVLKKLGRPE